MNYSIEINRQDEYLPVVAVNGSREEVEAIGILIAEVSGEHAFVTAFSDDPELNLTLAVENQDGVCWLFARALETLDENLAKAGK